MAEVFRAHDEMLDREVAVKVFRSQAPTSGTESGPERQETELHVLARLNHPNLITLFDGTLIGSHAYLVMELIDGPSLSARIAEGPVPEHRSARSAARSPTRSPTSTRRAWSIATSSRRTSCSVPTRRSAT